MITVLILIIIYMLTPAPPELSDIGLNVDLVATQEFIEGRDWNGDGTIYKEYKLNDNELESILQQVEVDAHWKNEVSDELKDFMSFDDFNGIYEVKNGYSFFKDRYPDAKGDIYRYNKARISSRGSVDVTVAVLDVNNKKLYYLVWDT